MIDFYHMKSCWFMEKITRILDSALVSILHNPLKSPFPEQHNVDGNLLNSFP